MSLHLSRRLTLIVFLISFQQAFAQAPAGTLLPLVEELGGQWIPDKGRFMKSSKKLPLTPEKITALLKLPEVKSLLFNGVEVDLPTAKAIRLHGQHLESLIISHFDVGSAEYLGTFAEMKKLTELMVGSSDFGDDGLAIIATMPNLKKLQLVHVSRNPDLPITAKGLNALADGVPGLEFLSLNLHRMEPEMIPALARFKQLKTLEIEWASPAFHARVREALPNTEVRARGGRYVRDGFDAAAFDPAKDLTDEDGQPPEKVSKPSDPSKPKTSAAIGIVPPIFPFWQKRFEGDEAWLKEAGYSPRPWTKPSINLTEEASFDKGKLEQWMKANSGGVVMLHFKEVATEADEDRAMPELRRLAAAANEANVQMVVYPYFGCHINTAERALTFLQKLNCPNVGLTLHMPQEIKNGNASRFPEIIAKVKDAIRLVVVCGADAPKPGDETVSEWDWSRLVRPLGDGDYDVGKFVKAVHSSGYRGSYAFICWQFKEPPQTFLTRSMDTWRSYFPEAGQ